MHCSNKRTKDDFGMRASSKRKLTSKESFRRSSLHGCSGISPPFNKSLGLLLYAHEAATGPCPEPDGSIPRQHNPLFERSIYLRLGLLYSLQVFRLKFCMQFLFLPFVPTCSGRPIPLQFLSIIKCGENYKL
jgi:hypothetical protein